MPTKTKGRSIGLGTKETNDPVETLLERCNEAYEEASRLREMLDNLLLWWSPHGGQPGDKWVAPTPIPERVLAEAFKMVGKDISVERLRRLIYSRLDGIEAVSIFYSGTGDSRRVDRIDVVEPDPKKSKSASLDPKQYRDIYLAARDFLDHTLGEKWDLGGFYGNIVLFNAKSGRPWFL